MGTNYYITCTCCGTRLKHIGKQSAGWKFKSNLSKESFDNLELNKNRTIVDEYGTYLTKEQLIKEVTKDWDLHEDGDKWFNSGNSGWS